MEQIDPTTHREVGSEAEIFEIAEPPPTLTKVSGQHTQHGTVSERDDESAMGDEVGASGAHMSGDGNSAAAKHGQVRPLTGRPEQDAGCVHPAGRLTEVAVGPLKLPSHRWACRS
jgi:hypothetical protein